MDNVETITRKVYKMVSLKRSILIGLENKESSIGIRLKPLPGDFFYLLEEMVEEKSIGDIYDYYDAVVHTDKYLATLSSAMAGVDSSSRARYVKDNDSRLNKDRNINPKLASIYPEGSLKNKIKPSSRDAQNKKIQDIFKNKVKTGGAPGLQDILKNVKKHGNIEIDLGNYDTMNPNSELTSPVSLHTIQSKIDKTPAPQVSVSGEGRHEDNVSKESLDKSIEKNIKVGEPGSTDKVYEQPET